MPPRTHRVLPHGPRRSRVLLPSVASATLLEAQSCTNPPPATPWIRHHCDHCGPTAQPTPPVSTLHCSCPSRKAPPIQRHIQSSVTGLESRTSQIPITCIPTSPHGTMIRFPTRPGPIVCPLTAMEPTPSPRIPVSEAAHTFTPHRYCPALPILEVAGHLGVSVFDLSKPQLRVRICPERKPPPPPCLRILTPGQIFPWPATGIKLTSR